MNGKEKLFRGLSIQTFVTLTMGILEIVYFSFMSRLLTKTDFGYFATITAVIAIFYSISEAGLGSSIIQRKEDSQNHINTAFSLAVISGSFFAILLFLLSPVIANLVSDSGITMPLRIMSSILLLNSLNSIANGLLSRRLNFKRIGILQISAYSLSIIVAIFLAFKGYGIIALVTNAIMYPLILCIGYYSIGIERPRFRIHKEHIKSILNFGGWLTAGVIVNNLTHQVDKLLLPRLMSVQALGAYNRPAGFVTTISTKINGIFDSVLFPILAKYQDDKGKVQDIFYKAISLLNIFSILLASAFMFNASLVIRIFFGEEWLDLVFITQIVSLSVVFSINGRLVDCFFRSLNYVKMGFMLRCVIFVLTTCCIVMGTRHGLRGLAFSLVIANISGIVLKIYFLTRKINTNFYQVIGHWLGAWKLALPILAAYLLYHYFVSIDSWTTDLMFFAIFCVLVFIEYILFPKFVGKEYHKITYPIIEKYLKIRTHA